MKVKVNEEACISCGACEAICPEIFELNDERISTCKKNDITKENEEIKNNVREAMDSCPTGAIVEVSEEDKNK